MTAVSVQSPPDYGLAYHAAVHCTTVAQLYNLYVHLPSTACPIVRSLAIPGQRNSQAACLDGLVGSSDVQLQVEFHGQVPRNLWKPSPNLLCELSNLDFEVAAPFASVEALGVLLDRRLLCKCGRRQPLECDKRLVLSTRSIMIVVQPTQKNSNNKNKSSKTNSYEIEKQR